MKYATEYQMAVLEDLGVAGVNGANATGKDVRIDYPDLSAFVEVVSTGEVPAA